MKFTVSFRHTSRSREYDGIELERFKAEINLVEYGVAQGYIFDRQESSRNSAVIRHPNGDKIVIATDRDGHGIYFSVRDPNDHGTIIDFVQRRKGLNLGQVRRELRSWVGSEILFPTAQKSSGPNPFPKPKPIYLDRVRLVAEWYGMSIYSGTYLHERGLSTETISEFSAGIRQDRRGNTLFWHRDTDGITGWEIKNHHFTGFSSGGTKSLFAHQIGIEVMRIVVVESAIDALSYHQLRGSKDTMYLSLAGSISQAQSEVLKSVLVEYSQASVVVATDRDPSGDEQAFLIRQMRPGVLREIPEDSKDWNDQLMARC